MALIGGQEGLQYQFAWWLRAADESQLQASIAQLANAAGVAPLGTAVETLQMLVAAMRQPGMVVFDDAESWQAVEPFVDATGPSHVVVTTATDTPEGVRVRGLDTSGPVLEFVSKRAEISSADAKKLIEAVDGMPLLLLHACQFIAKNNSSVDEYLGLLAKPSALFDSWPYRPPDYVKPHSRIIPLGVVQLASEDPRWRELCAVLATLAPAPIPLRLLDEIDGDANAFAMAAQSAFLLTLDRSSQTVEVPTLIRNALGELGLPSADRQVRRRIWSAMERLGGDAIPSSHRAYLAEHILHLGLDPLSVGAATQLARTAGSRSLATSMWRHAYRSAIDDKPKRHLCERAVIATEFGWALLAQGQYVEGGRVLRLELEMANDAGCIACRAPLLHVLGHLAENELSPENEVLRTFRSAESAMRIIGSRNVEYGQVLADIVLSCVVGISNALKREEVPSPSVSKLEAEGTRCLEDLTELKNELLPLSSSRVSSANLNRWTRAAKSWDRVSEQLAKYMDDLEAKGCESAQSADRPQSSKPSLAALFTNLTGLLASQMDDAEAFERTVSLIEALERDAAKPSARAEDAAALRVEAASLRKALTRQFGEESQTLALVDLLDMTAAAAAGDEQPAASACHRFVGRLLGATNIMTTRRILLSALLFDAKEVESVPLGQTHKTLIAHAPWVALVPGVEAYIWLLDEALSDSVPATTKRQNVHQAIQGVGQMGSSGVSVAAQLAHLYGHNEGLSPGQSLHYHRIAARLFMKIGVPAPDWGYALYCYAHGLLELGMAEAAERRFVEARNILTMVDSESGTVSHIDEHLNSPVAPYLPGE